MAAAALLLSCSNDEGSSDDGLVPAPTCATPTRGEIIDLIPLARLAAVGTATTLGDWTREDQDELPTIRDDRQENGWRPGEEGNAVAQIDLGPAGGPFALRSLTLTWAGTPGAVEVRVRDACGGGLVARAKPAGATVSLGDVCGACVEIAVAEGLGARLVSARLESASPTPKLLPALPDPVKPAATHRDLGVIEGFYGQPWTWDERARIVDALGAAGLGLYVYAPKDDPLHRAKWRTPYHPDFVARFGALAKLARARGVRAVIAVSPFIDFDPAGTDRDVLVNKLKTFVDAGADGIALFADDIELETSRPIDGALGALHAEVVNDVVSTLRVGHPDLAALFVGTVYSDARRASMPTADAYLDALKALDPSVRIFWTGADTFSPSISAASLSSIQTAIGRPPAVWDNHWATDAGDAFFGRVLLAPLRDRNGDLLAATSAFVQNPSIPGATARLQTALFGAWAAAPSASVDDHRAAAAVFEGRYAAYEGDAAPRVALVQRVMTLFEGSGLNDDFPRHRALEAALGRIGSNVPLDDVRLALSIAADARTTASEVAHSTLATDLVDELSPPLLKVSAAADVVLLALERIAAAQAGEDTTALSATLTEADTTLKRRSRFLFLDDAIHAFVARALAVTPSASRPRPHSTGPLPECVVGRALTLSPFAEATTVEAHGLAGAVVEGARVRWTPPHPGRFDVVFVAPPDETHGWSTRTETLVCRP